MNKKQVGASRKARLHSLYQDVLKKDLQQKLGLQNIMQVPRLEKVVINVGAKEAVADTKILQVIENVLSMITGQKPIRTVAKKSIAGFKIREGMPLGVKVTLRGSTMYAFLDKLINLSLPKVRDFQGVTRKMDGRGSYNLGIKDWSIFPEVDALQNERSHGLNITVHMRSLSDAHSFELLKGFGMPFKKQASSR
jgi:large subunit ribosomal protein L5